MSRRAIVGPQPTSPTWPNRNLDIEFEAPDYSSISWLGKHEGIGFNEVPPYYQLMEIFSRGLDCGTAPFRWLRHDVPRVLACTKLNVEEIRAGPDSARQVPRLPDRGSRFILADSDLVSTMGQVPDYGVRSV
jgi:hypothetical protein